MFRTKVKLIVFEKFSCFEQNCQYRLRLIEIIIGNTGSGL